MQFEVEDAKIESLLLRYFAVKNLMLISEDVDGDLKANLQIYNELRSCLDHLMACFIWKCGSRSEEILSCARGMVLQAEENEAAEGCSRGVAPASTPTPGGVECDDAGDGSDEACDGDYESSGRDSEEFDKNISSALKHLDRAFFDACDFTYLSSRRRIEEAVSSHSKADIRTAIPIYYAEIKPFLNRLGSQTIAFRNARTQNTQSKEEIVARFARNMYQLQVYTKHVLDAEPTLLQLSSERGRQETMKFESRPSSILVFVLGCVLGAALLVFLSGGPGRPFADALRTIFGNLATCLLG